MDAVIALVAIVALILLVNWMLKPKGRCRQCRGRVDAKATVCPHCGNHFAAAESP